MKNEIEPCIHDFLIKDIAICMLSCYVSVLLSFKTACILSLCSLFSAFLSLGFWYFILHIFLLCPLNLTISGLSIFSKFPVMILSPYIHSILISNANSRSFPFKALCSFVCSVTLHSPPFLKLRIAFQNLPLYTTSVQHHPIETSSETPLGSVFFLTSSQS